MAEPASMRTRRESLPIVKEPIEDAKITQLIVPFDRVISEMHRGRAIWLTGLVGAIAFFALVFLY